jgi:ABC-type sugar transport system ATPase subunit
VVAIALHNVSKSFPGVRALANVTLSIFPRTIHGLVGENGSGKSTLMKLIGGSLVADSGSRIEINGVHLSRPKPADTIELGVAVIPQELQLVPELSLLENVFVGEYPHRGPFTDRRAMRREFAALCGQFGLQLDPDVRARNESVAHQTLIEIMRAVRRRARVLLMDEPTASLGSAERESLYSIVRSLQTDGLTIVFISHNLDEVLGLCDSISVLRDGVLAATGPASTWTKRDLVQHMLGEKDEGTLAPAILSSEPIGRRERSRIVTSASEALRVRNLGVAGRLRSVSFAVNAGEIVGLAGLVGSGRSTTLRALAGAESRVTGEIWLDGSPRKLPKTIRGALRQGIALLPEDRKSQGLVLERSAYDNVTLTDLRSVSRFLFVRRRTSIERTETLLRSLNFRGRIRTPVRLLSGGNQQKVVFAKWLHRRTRVFLVDEPTRGVDIGAKAEMLGMLRRVADEGSAVVFVSSEFEEVVAVADRVVMISDGASHGELRGTDITIPAIMSQLFRLSSSTTS